MTKAEFNDLRTGDIVYPMSGDLEGHAFEVIDVYTNEIHAALLESYVKEWNSDERTKCIRTYEEGYVRVAKYTHWATAIKRWW